MISYLFLFLFPTALRFFHYSYIKWNFLSFQVRVTFFSIINLLTPTQFRNCIQVLVFREMLGLLICLCIWGITGHQNQQGIKGWLLITCQLFPIHHNNFQDIFPPKGVCVCNHDAFASVSFRNQPLLQHELS